MTNRRLANGEKDTPKHSDATLKPGDVTWVKLRGFSWWPAQVVDEKSVHKGCRPRKKNKEAVLLRLYGSYEYVYRVEPSEGLSEFKKVLEQQNCSCSDMIQKAVDRAMQRPSSAKNSLKSTDAQKQQNPGGSNKRSGSATLTSEDSDTCETLFSKSPEMSARRLKVMQSLGLMPPSGSPFYRNGHVEPML